jgi:hypothetical protein
MTRQEETKKMREFDTAISAGDYNVALDFALMLLRGQGFAADAYDPQRILSAKQLLQKSAIGGNKQAVAALSELPEHSEIMNMELRGYISDSRLIERIESRIAALEGHSTTKLFTHSLDNLYTRDVDDPVLTAYYLESMLSKVIPRFLVKFTLPPTAISYVIFREDLEKSELYLVASAKISITEEAESEVDATRAIKEMLQQKDCQFSELLLDLKDNLNDGTAYAMSIRLPIDEFIRGSKLLITTDCYFEGKGHNWKFAITLINMILAALSFTTSEKLALCIEAFSDEAVLLSKLFEKSTPFEKVRSVVYDLLAELLAERE